jgi:hypothetical protein
MMVFQITGGMLRAARSLTGLSQKELAERGGLSRHSIRSAQATPSRAATYSHLCRVE